MSYVKTKPISSKKLRDAARGEDCTLQLPCCTHDTQTTVLAHLPDESHGMGRKSDDLSACFACDACHGALDGRTTPNATQLVGSGLDWYMRRAQTRTWRRLYERGLFTIQGAA